MKEVNRFRRFQDSKEAKKAKRLAQDGMHAVLERINHLKDSKHTITGKGGDILENLDIHIDLHTLPENIRLIYRRKIHLENLKKKAKKRLR